MVCPLAFGEVGIKERVKSVLNYKKPTLWIIIAAAAVLVILAVCFLTNPAREYQIKITIPAGSTEPICYSDEEISPKGNTLTFYAGEGLGDTEITLLPIEVREENTYDEPAYITPGMSVKMDVEKGAWYKIGVSIQNPTEESMDVYVSVDHVEVRIAATGNQINVQEDGLISSKVAEEVLQRYLFAIDQWNKDYMIEPLNPVDGMIENTKVYRFEVRYQDTVEQVSGRLVGNYAVTDDGNNVYWYDSANDAFIMLQDVSKDIVSLYPDEETLTEKSSIQDILLYEQPEADTVCIKVQPSMIGERTYYYYIPTGEDQKWLSAQVEALNLEGEPWKRRWEGHKEKGWQIVYNDVEIRAFEGGYLYYTYDDEEGIMECFTEAPELCDYIQIMLMEKIGYQNYDVSDIKDIVSAKLDVKSTFTGGQFYSQTITDAETLQKFEEWFSNAEYMYGGTECGTQCACLELTLANGNVVKLSMATDSCPNFHIDGVAYDYRPVSDWNNSEFYQCFDEILWGL